MDAIIDWYLFGGVRGGDAFCGECLYDIGDCIICGNGRRKYRCPEDDPDCRSKVVKICTKCKNVGWFRAFCP